MLRNISSQKQKLIRALVKNAETMIQAGMSRTTRTCGKHSCACHADASRRHGPNTYLTFRNAEGRSSGLYVSPEHLEEATEAKQAWNEFWSTATALAAINREELKVRWQAAGKARAKK
jgi:hypothetical protein